MAINLINGLHTYYPQVPSFPTQMWDARLDLGKFLVGFGRPWDAASGMLYMCLYPFIFGLGLLLPAELSLSIWVFCGDQDGVFKSNEELVQTVVQAGSQSIRFTSLENVGHNSWSAAYASPDLYQWLDRQSREKPPGDFQDSPPLC